MSPLTTTSPAPLQLVECIQLLKRGIETQDDALILRCLRKTTTIRKHLPLNDLCSQLSTLLPANLENRQIIFECLNQQSSSSSADGEILPEAQLYLRLLALRSAQHHSTCSHDQLERAAEAMMTIIRTNDRRTMDILSARAWHTYSLIKQPFSLIRDQVTRAHRTACLRLDEAGQATLTNLILRDLVESDLITEASMFASKSKFPDRASNNQHVRYLYYTGRIEAMQLEYGAALSLLQQAIRKAPTNTGLGFRIAVHKLTSVVQLLTGETPERLWFSDTQMSSALAPYLELVRSVRQGSVSEFEQCLERNRQVFGKDRTFSLITRLHSSVIKMGLRAVNLCYSRIAFADVAKKLDVAPEAIEYVCCKAIRDGVLDASVDSEGRYLQSSQPVDVYSSTSDPMKAFQRRGNFLLEVHNDAIKAMRFPPEAGKKKVVEEELDPEKLEDLQDVMDVEEE